ncbi:VTC domain-containing protein [Candidatus Pelagibacter sp.]|uniref:VTC domain-containing protein n=1 Tax=Candidatus Pelagibacter sp. TaxID=2024849 RepID=UPI003F86310F
MNDTRLELKYLISLHQTNKILKILNTLPFSLKEKYQPRLVNNIYFDTYKNHSLMEHLDGIKNRYKIRIRWYGDFFSFFNPTIEFKIKNNKLTTKKKFLMKNFSSEILASKKKLISFLKTELINNKIINFSQNFKVARIISYKRKYFEAKKNKIRFTLDENLTYKFYSKDNLILLDNLRKFKQRPFNILELKCEESQKQFIPLVEKNLQLKSQSFSKFIDFRY